MKQMLTTLLLIAAMNAAGQDFQAFIDRVNGIADEEDKAVVVDSFMNAVSMFPFIEESTAYFIYRGTVTSVSAVGDFNGWNPANEYVMDNLSGTDFWYTGREFESNARLDYKFVVNGSDWILDPLNPRTISGGFGPNSELAMPEYVQPWEVEEYPSIDKGTVETITHSSTIMGTSHQVKIYLPPNYDANRETGYAVAYFQDGNGSISLGSAVNVMDNLIDAETIDEIIGVFVEPNNRGTEYAGASKTNYRDFFVDELVPYIDQNYNTVPNERHRAVIGASLGGNIAAYIAYTHPEVFGNCGMHSGALWVDDQEIFNLVANGPVVDVKMVNIWGSYESSSIQMPMGALAAHFANEGYDHISYDLPEGHSWGLWRSTFDDMLEFFFAHLTTSIVEDAAGIDFDFLYNSSQSVITYQFDLKEERQFDVILVDLSGRIAHHKRYTGIGMISGDLDVGQLPVGLYHFVVDLGDELVNRKISVVR